MKPTQAQRDDVELMVVAGMSQQAIAKALGTDKETLEKHFRLELDDGVGRKHLEVLGMLHAAAKKGNVSAQKKLLEVTDQKKAAAQLEKHIPVRLQPGKKEQAAQEAQTAGEGTKWQGFLHGAQNKPADFPN